MPVVGWPGGGFPVVGCVAAVVGAVCVAGGGVWLAGRAVTTGALEATNPGLTGCVLATDIVTAWAVGLSPGRSGTSARVRAATDTSRTLTAWRWASRRVVTSSRTTVVPFSRATWAGEARTAPLYTLTFVIFTMFVCCTSVRGGTGARPAKRSLPRLIWTVSQVGSLRRSQLSYTMMESYRRRL